MTKIHLLGVDQGLASVGFAVLELDLITGEKAVAKMGTITTKASDTKPKRFEQIGSKLERLIEDYGIRYVATEKLFTVEKNIPGKKNFYKDGVTDANYMTGIIYYICGRHDIDLQLYVPGTVKKQSTGDGRASKEKVIAHMLAFLDVKEGKRKPSTHTMDAVAIAITLANKEYQNMRKAG